MRRGIKLRVCIINIRANTAIKCAAKLATVGLEVDLVMCAGKTVYDQDERAFHTYEYKLDQYEL